MTRISVSPSRAESFVPLSKRGNLVAGKWFPLEGGGRATDREDVNARRQLLFSSFSRPLPRILVRGPCGKGLSMKVSGIPEDGSSLRYSPRCAYHRTTVDKNGDALRDKERRKKKEKKQSCPNLSSPFFFGRAIFYPNETKRNQQFEEFLEWTKNRLRGDKEKRVTRLRATTPYGAPRFCSRGSHKCVVLSSNSVLDATFHYVVRSNPPSLASIHKAG